MTFASRMTSTARAYDADRGGEVAGLCPDHPAPVQQLLVGVAGCSPYLAGLMQSEAAWLNVALDDPEAAQAAILSAVAALDHDALEAGLRQAKRRTALLAAVADVGGVWPLATVTGALTDLANAAVDRCLETLVGREIARGKLPGMTADDAETAGGMVALAMGKMGAGELNYSSDIDLICLFDEGRFEVDDYHDARAAFIRVTRRMTALLSDVKAGGYVFRTDLRLRPDASVTPVCLSMEAAERYYESVGRTWERAAYIKAAPSGGDIAAGWRFLDSLRPFVWRKHLDFAAIQDAHDMRLRIRDHKGLGGVLKLEGHNVKLGQGGIREIEFFTQTRQLIAGGRDTDLRLRGTVEGLAALAGAGWISDDVAATLTAHYTEHRKLEHRLQMINDAQTHDLPKDGAGFDRLAAFMDTEVAPLRQTLEARFAAVHDLTEGFFAPDAAKPADTWGSETTARWATYPALRSSRATEIFARLWPDISARLQEAARPDEALAQFDRFLAGLPAGVQLFSLFEANPPLSQLIVDIAATAPALAAFLGRNSGVLDAVIGGRFFDAWPGVAALQETLGQIMAREPDYEARLNAARRWQKEWHFGVGVHHLRGLIDAEAAGARYADLAQAVIAALWPVVTAEFAAKHGEMPGKGAIVLGMGSLGAARLNAMSDLDLIVIYDAGSVEASDGRRPLATRPYYARLTQALVTALSAPMGEGRLYEVDMRLRPSGRQGPVATSWGSFSAYQQDEAWTWEHLALTRARTVAGNPALADQFEAFRCRLLPQKGQGATVVADVADMRSRLAEAKPAQGPWDAKSGVGRLQDIELCAQTAGLIAGTAARDLAGQLAAGVAAGWLDAADEAALNSAAGLLWQLQAAGRLLAGGVFDPEAVGEGGRRFMLRETGFTTMDDLGAAVASRTATAADVIARLIGEAAK